MTRHSHRHGGSFTARLGPSSDVVFLADREETQAVFRGPAKELQMGDINGLFRRVLGPNSLLLLDGEEHMRQRRLLLPPFHGPRIAEQRAEMQAIAEDHIERWPEGTPFALQPSMQAITLDIIISVVFGMPASPERTRMRRLLARLLDLNATLPTVLPQLRIDLGGRSPWGRILRCTDAVDRVLYAEIARRRSDDDRDGRDVLSLLLAARDEDGEPMSDRELRDQLLTLLVAGHETTATALAWAFERLTRHPQASARLREEIDAGRTSYLDAVIKETLRVRPVLPIVGRKLTAPFTIKGTTYASGTILMPSVYLAHRDPEAFPDPTAFRPERFLGAGVPPSSWIPFGGGVRRCLGASFATVEMQAVITAVVRRVDLCAVSQRPERIARRTFTLSPGQGARVVARRRPSG